MTQTHETDLADLIYEIASSGDVCLSARMSGLYRSDDAGKSWQSVYDSLELTEALATLTVVIPPNFQQEPSLFAGINGGILRSPDGGQTWERAFFPAPPTTITTMQASPNYASDGTLFAGTLEDGIFFSRNRGQTWRAGNFGLLDLSVYALAVSPNYADDSTLYAGTQTGIFRSTNGGRSWRDVQTPVEYPAVLSLALSLNDSQDQTLYAGTEVHGLLCSTDAGGNWSHMGENHIDEAINAIQITPQNSELLILHGDTLLNSSDNGESWQHWNEKLLAGKSISAIHAQQGLEAGGIIYVGLQDGEILTLKSD